MEGTVSGRGRVSMYRGIFTGLARPEESFTGLTRHAKPNTNASVLAANTLFIATTARGSTGSFTVLPLHRTGLIAANEPHICTNEVSNGAPPSPVRDLAFNPFNEQVVASAGRAISLWKIPKKGLVADLVDPLLTLQDACAGELSSTKLIRFHPTTPNILVSASIDNSFRLWDVDACKALLKTSFGMVTNVVWDSLGAEFLVSSSVTDVKLCDPRQKQFDGVNFPGTARHTGFFVTGDSSTFVTVELRYSNIIKLWDSRSVGTELGSLKLQAESSHLHLPLYDRDGKLLYIPDKSDRKLSVFELSTQEPLIRALRTSQASTAVKAFTMLPRRALKVADCEVGRILRLTAEGIQPMSFYVPRIHEAFQEDLYPPTFCGQPSQTAKQWWDEHTTNIPVVDSLLGEYQSTLGATRVDEVNFKALESGAYTDEEFLEDDADDGKAGSLRGSIFEDEEVPPKIAFGTPMLKFGKNGATREKRVWIEDERHICWDGALISPKWGKKCSGTHAIFSLFIQYL